MSSPNRSYVQGFDGLRGVAIILILLHHIELFGKWRVGPEIFFMLSGFLTTRSLQRQRGDTVVEALLSFYRRRLLRLTPPLLALLAILTPVLGMTAGVDAGARDLLAAASYTINWQQALTPWESPSLAHLWSLAAEQQFYLVWAPLFLLCPRRWMRPLLVVMVGMAVGWRFWLSAHGAGFNRIYFGFDTHADALLMGCLLALVAVPERFEPVLRPAGAASLAVMTAAALMLPLATPGGLCASITLTTGLTALVIAGVRLDGGWLGAVMALPPLQAVGRMSYSLYLWNFPVIALCHPHWHHGLKALQLAVLGSVSAVNYVLVEKPLTRYLRMRRTPEPVARQPEPAMGGPPRAWVPATSAS